MMKVCEVCGLQEEWNESEKDEIRMETGLLHVCDNCKQDRHFHPFNSVE
ncbi:hypothetical protein M3181_24130 [Mesobacillus maritimus]|nr:hypothetical protein [Mesobacillus maritimus]MCM3672003.1 hypothetical protein [Mesobacillus maritimus]